MWFRSYGMSTCFEMLLLMHRDGTQISQAVGVGFVVMGAIGYIVKLGRCPDECRH